MWFGLKRKRWLERQPRDHLVQVLLDDMKFPPDMAKLQSNRAWPQALLLLDHVSDALENPSVAADLLLVLVGCVHDAIGAGRRAPGKPVAHVAQPGTDENFAVSLRQRV